MAMKTKLEARMVDLPKKKVGIVACSGEELPEGTITRLAALKVLEQLRPSDTVTICLPLFLAGGAGDRAFAKFYPTIAVDGCELRCAGRATEMYSSKPAASLMVRDLIAERGLAAPAGLRKLNAAGQQAVEITANQIAGKVDELLEKRWDRRLGKEMGEPTETQLEVQSEVQATCSCGSGIPIQMVTIAGKSVTLAALPVLFQQSFDAGKAPSEQVSRELLDLVKIYNPIPLEEETETLRVIEQEYALFWEKGSSR
jgi:uncharacterized metal-binding protein